MKDSLSPGMVVTHCDGEKTHKGVLLGVNGDDAWVVFLTTNPNWNPQARLLTDDERKLVGLPSRRATWFAPVVRYVGDLIASDSYFPDHRVVGLLHEFDFRRAANL